MSEAPKRIWNSGNVWAEVRSGLSMFRERLVQAFDAGNYELESARLDDVARRITGRIDPLFDEHTRLMAEKDAEIERLREALKEIARQKKTNELETEYDVEVAAFDDGYDFCIDRARAALGDSHE